MRLLNCVLLLFEGHFKETDWRVEFQKLLV